MSTTIKAIFMAAGFLLLLCKLTGCDTNPGKTKKEKIEYLTDKAFKDHRFIGNVLVIDSGQIVFKKSYGKANAKLAIPNSDSSKFLIASLSKPFTAVLILKLAEEGKVNIEDGIGKFFPETKPLKVGKVTIHHLLSHTSGLKELISEEHVFEGNDLKDAGFNFDPGSNFEYSNSGYVILKRIAEIASGTPYGDLVNRLIFRPLQMTSSGVASNLTTIPDLAIGYTEATQQKPDKISYSLEIVDGAGSLFSTAADIGKFSEGIDSEKFLSSSSRNLMFRQHVKEKFGYGWYLRERSGMWDVAYHKGDLPGYTSFLSRKIGASQMILLFANVGGLDLSDLENDIAKVLKTKE